MSTRFPPSRFPANAKADEKKEDSAEVNALWRIPQWYPDLGTATLTLLHLYHSELLKFNSRLNLISRNTERDADEVHFADCILSSRCLSKVKFDQPVYDLGSGNGFPGLIFAILHPQTQFVLVESDSRKCEFLKHMVTLLKLGNCQISCVRLETLPASGVGIALSRGFANLTKSVLAVNKIMGKGGRFYHLKGSTWGSEIAEIPTQVISVWSPELTGEYVLPESQARRAVVCTLKKA